MKRPRNIPINGHEPVTQTEFSSTMPAIKKEFDRMATKENLEEVKEEVTNLKEEVRELKEEVRLSRRVQERMLKILESIEGRMKESVDIPQRVEKLEYEVFLLKTRQKSK